MGTNKYISKHVNDSTFTENVCLFNGDEFHFDLLLGVMFSGNLI